MGLFKDMLKTGRGPKTPSVRLLLTMVENEHSFPETVKKQIPGKSTENQRKTTKTTLTKITTTTAATTTTTRTTTIKITLRARSKRR